MAIIKCKMCGGDLTLLNGQSVAECEYCGSRQTVPSADSEKKLNLFGRANRLRTTCDFDKAAGIYESILAEFPDEAEAYWGLVLCKYGIEYVDDPATGKKIPTCHRSSFESVMDDSNFDQAMENADELALRVYREEAKEIERIRKGILAVSAQEQPYDIFICYKETDAHGDRTVDSLLAQGIYDALVETGYRVFFSRITLEDKLGQAYEPYIFAALNSAKIMLVVGTCYEHYHAVWVRNEWSRYLKIMAQDKNKYLIPCYKGMDAYDIPKEFAHLQGQDMGKVGAIQDLLRGIEKILPKHQNVTVIQERVVVGGGGDHKIASLLDRGNMALEDGDWAKADSFFEDVLNNDSKNAQAYLGKTLAQEKCRTIDAFARKRKDASRNVQGQKLSLEPRHAHVDEMVQKFSLPGYVEQSDIRNLYTYNLSYHSDVAERKQQYKAEEAYWANHKQLSRAEKFAVGAVAENLTKEKQALFAVLADRVKKAEAAETATKQDVQKGYETHLHQADQKAEALYRDGLARKEQYYQELVKTAQTSSDMVELKEAAKELEKLDGYPDSKNLVAYCYQRIEEVQAEAKRQWQKRQAKKKRNAMIFAMIVSIVVVFAMAVSMVIKTVVIPGNHYQKAEQLMADGNIAEAAIAFGAAGDYRDAKERSTAAWEQIAVRETISAGKLHTVALKPDGTVIAVGENLYGRRNVSDWTEIIAISADYSHTVGLKSDGTVVAVGGNIHGQCDVSGWRDIVAISAGDSHTVGLKSDGTVVAVGSNLNGQCNVSDWTDIVAISADDYHTVGLKSDGTVVAVGADGFGQCDVSSWSGIVDIGAGRSHTVGLRFDSTVVAIGDSDYDQCDVSRWRDIVAISVGEYHTVGLKSNGTVVAVGNNEYGECNVSDWTDIVAISAGSSHTVGLKSDGTVVAVGYNDYGQCNVSGWTGIKLPN